MWRTQREMHMTCIPHKTYVVLEVSRTSRAVRLTREGCWLRLSLVPPARSWGVFVFWLFVCGCRGYGIYSRHASVSREVRIISIFTHWHM